MKTDSKTDSVMLKITWCWRKEYVKNTLDINTFAEECEERGRSSMMSSAVEFMKSIGITHEQIEKFIQSAMPQYKQL